MQVGLEMPALFIAAQGDQGDPAVTPSLSEGMSKIVTDLTIEIVNTGYFCDLIGTRSCP